MQNTTETRMQLATFLAAGLAVSVSGSGVSHRVLRGAVQSELKEKYSVVKRESASFRGGGCQLAC